MRFQAIAILFFALSGAAAAVEIKNQYFHLNLPGDWQQQEGADSEQFIVTSDSRQAQVTISYVPMNAKGRDLEQIANKLLEFRFAAEREAAADREIFFSEPWGSKPQDGGLQVNYMGHDSLGRYFFFAGFITETHTTSVTGELEHSNEPALHAFYKEVLSNFGY
ncbi:hypothetical protein [Lysobacter sp. Root983]|uniref:hypothetical protein n=1 Tax=Lysobacter sp. Root983 TaxID=1736613 RepID=UPI00070C5CBD|nr:hypothetical protein [Lysobacter sp. Root983]KRD79846.1 hypothetical protein ASE43_02805 [Lysobacter sp. Root983]